MTLSNSIKKGSSEWLDLLEFDESGRIDISWKEISWIYWRMFLKSNGINQILGWSNILVNKWFINRKWDSLFINIISWVVLKIPSNSLYLSNSYFENTKFFQYWLNDFKLNIIGDCVWGDDNMILFLRSLNITIWNKIVKFSGWEINIEEKGESLISELLSELVSKYWLIIGLLVIFWSIVTYEDFSKINWNIKTEVRNWKSSVAKVLENWWNNNSFEKLWINSQWVDNKIILKEFVINKGDVLGDYGIFDKSVKCLFRTDKDTWKVIQINPTNIPVWSKIQLYSNNEGNTKSYISVTFPNWECYTSELIK